MSRMPAGDWIGATEAATMARVHRHVVMEAIKSGALAAWVQQHAERKRILIQREDARRWISSLPAAQTRNMPIDWPRWDDARFLAAMLSLYEAGRVRSPAWCAPAHRVLCQGAPVSVAVREAGFVGSGLSGALSRLVRAGAELADADVAAARALLGNASFNSGELAAVAAQEAARRKTERETARRAAWQATQHIESLQKLNQK